MLQWNFIDHWFILFFKARLVSWMVVDAWKSLGREGLIRKLKKDLNYPQLCNSLFNISKNFEEKLDF